MDRGRHRHGLRFRAAAGADVVGLRDGVAMMETKELQELLGRVTPGPWSVGKEVIGIRNDHGFQHHIVHLLWDDIRGKSDAALIAAAPDLAAEVLRLRGEVAALTAANAKLAAEQARAVEVITFYANKANYSGKMVVAGYQDYSMVSPAIEDDNRSDRARAFLAGEGK